MDLRAILEGAIRGKRQNEMNRAVMQEQQDALMREAMQEQMRMRELEKTGNAMTIKVEDILKALGGGGQMSDIDMQRMNQMGSGGLMGGGMRPASDMDIQGLQRMMQQAPVGAMPPVAQPPRMPLGMSYPVQR